MKCIEYIHTPITPGDANGRHRLCLNVGPLQLGLGWVIGNEIPLDWFALNRPPCFGFTLWLRRLGFGFRWERRDWAWQNGQ